MTLTLRHNHVTNTLKLEGVSWGKLTMVKVNTRDMLIVVHVSGHNYWSGRGQPQQYAPAQFAVFKYESCTKKNSETTYQVDYPPTLQFDVRVPK